MGSQAERTRGKAAAGGPDKAVDCGLGSPTFVGGTTGERNRPHNPGSQFREVKPQISD